MTHPGSRPGFSLAVIAVCIAGLCWAAPSEAQITAVARPGATPPWDKGMIPINAESYYHAIECGKQGGEDPPCVFWDTGLCKNDDFTLAFYSAYKQVAYEVWTAVRKKQPAPQPSYQAAQRTRVTIGVTPVPGSKNAFTDLVLKRGGKAVPPAVRTVSGRHRPLHVRLLRRGHRPPPSRSRWSARPARSRASSRPRCSGSSADRAPDTCSSLRKVLSGRPGRGGAWRPTRRHRGAVPGPLARWSAARDLSGRRFERGDGSIDHGKERLHQVRVELDARALTQVCGCPLERPLVAVGPARAQRVEHVADVDQPARVMAPPPVVDLRDSRRRRS